MPKITMAPKKVLKRLSVNRDKSGGMPDWNLNREAD
jgi:hypothetical protein